MNTLVTGASGFVGQALVRRLLAEGDTGRALTAPGDRRLPERRALGSGERAGGAPVPAVPAGGARRLPELRALGSGDRLEVAEADVTDFDAVAAPCVGVRRVFHVAALVHGWHPFEPYRAVNVGGTQHIARAAHAQGVERFVHVSTSDVFGVPPD